MINNNNALILFDTFQVSENQFFLNTFWCFWIEKVLKDLGEDKCTAEHFHLTEKRKKVKFQCGFTQLPAEIMKLGLTMTWLVPLNFQPLRFFPTLRLCPDI